jgi:hypothetical protein
VNISKEKDKEIINLAIYIKTVKTLVTKVATNEPKFHLYSFQYFYMEGYTVDEAAFEIIVGLEGLTDIAVIDEMCDKVSSCLKAEILAIVTSEIPTTYYPTAQEETSYHLIKDGYAYKGRVNDGIMLQKEISTANYQTVTVLSNGSLATHKRDKIKAA